MVQLYNNRKKVFHSEKKSVPGNRGREMHNTFAKCLTELEMMQPRRYVFKGRFWETKDCAAG
jgi:hypothetical protein